MSKDSIYREDAIKAINARSDWYQVTCNGKQIAVMLMAKDVNEILEKLPSADRPQGEWLAVSSYDAFGGSEELWNAHGNPTAFHYCSKCKAQSYVNEFGEELLTDYCPNCGAQMKGADDE